AIHGSASDWTAPHGLKLGMALEDVEKANGKPFKLSGFGWDYGGLVVDWNKGALGNVACRTSGGFCPAPDNSLVAVGGGRNFQSRSSRDARCQSKSEHDRDRISG